MSSAEASLQRDLHTLYSEHQGWLFKWLVRKLGCPENAADLAQDTFVKLLARPGQLDDKRCPRAYLHTVAHGLVVDHWRRREIERAWLQTLAEQPELLAPSPEHQAMVLETLVQIDAMLDSLPPKPRRAFVMSQLHGASHAEIAQALGVSPRMVRNYLSQVMLHCLALDAQFSDAVR